MALLDILAQFTADAGDTVAHAAGTVNLTNQYDMGAISYAGNTYWRNIGADPAPYLVIQVSTAIVTGGSAGTITFQLASHSTATIPTDGTQSVHVVSPAFVTDDDPTIPAGTVLFNIELPSCKNPVSKSVAGVPVLTGPGAPYERFLGVQYVIGTTTTTAGAVKAYLTYDQQHRYEAYPKAPDWS